MTARPPGRPDRAAALISALLVLMIAGGLAAACLAAAPLAVRDAAERVSRTRAYYLALGAAARKHDELNRGFRDVLGPGGPLGSAPDGSSGASATFQADGSCRVAASGVAGGVADGVVAILRASGNDSPFRDAAFGVTGIESRRAILVDGYDSGTGSYLSQAPSPGSGPVAGNLGSNGSIALSGGAVHGDARPGPGGTFIGGGAVVTGSTAPSPRSRALPPAPFQPPEANDNAAIATHIDNGGFALGAGTASIPSGRYVLSSFAASGGAVVEIAGDVTLHVNGRFRIADLATVRLAPDSRLTIFATDDVNVSGGGILNQAGGVAPGLPASEGLPERLQLLVSGDPSRPAPVIELRAPTPFCGAIYAPGATVRTRRGFSLFGAIVADSIYLDEASLHYDAALFRAASPARAATGYRLVARWREKP